MSGRGCRLLLQAMGRTHQQGRRPRTGWPRVERVAGAEGPAVGCGIAQAQMASRDDRRLFDPDRDLLSDEHLAADQADALAANEGEADPELDSARLWRSRQDGLLVRGVHPHSALK